MAVMTAPAALAAFRVQNREKQQSAARDRYAHNPIAWIEERAKGFLYSKMREIAQSVHDHRRTVVLSCHESGKSWLAARLVGWWLDSSAPGEAFVVTTAPTAKQVKAVLWKEIRRVYVTAGMPGRMNQTEYWVNGEMVAMGRKPSDDSPTAFQGIHARKVLLLFDEADGIPEGLFIAGNSLIANEFGRMFAIGNPDNPDSYMAKVSKPGSGWNVISISAFDTPNFTEEPTPQIVKDVLISQIYVDEMKHDVGEDSAVYASKVLGIYPENKVDGVILLSWLRQCQDEDAVEQYPDHMFTPVELGMDVGAGGDETSIRERRGIVAGKMWEAKTPNPQQAFELAVRAIMETRATRMKIDIIGIGWALLGMLQMAALRGEHFDETLEEDIDISYCEFVGVNVGQSATDPTRFPRLRDQLWWEVGRELSRTKGWNLSYVDDTTISQLTDPLWKRDLANRHKVESKADTMKRTHRDSPNRADAILLAFCEPPAFDEEYRTVYHEPVTIGVAY